MKVSEVNTLITVSFALLAFTVAFYGFTARDKKTPYITGTVYSTIYVTLLGLVLAFLAKGVEAAANWLQFAKTPADWLATAGGVALVIATLQLAWRIWRVHHRNVNFRDDGLFVSLGPIRKLQAMRELHKGDKPYKYNSIAIKDDLLEGILNCRDLPVEELKSAAQRRSGKELSLSIVCKTSSLARAEPSMVDLAIQFLSRSECTIQYASCGRNPYEFVLRLKTVWDSEKRAEDWKQVARRIIAIDAYTPHFGFTDSIHPDFAKHFDLQTVEAIISPPSYAGLHTSAMSAFKKLRKRGRSDEVRGPTLVIYEAPFALADLESIEQYRVFVRHVLPSERVWGGMITFVVESGISEENIATLRTYADAYVNLDPSSSRRPPKRGGGTLPRPAPRRQQSVNAAYATTSKP